MAVRELTALVMAFDVARRAFELEAAPGWDDASRLLREAFSKCAHIGNASTLPCPVAWWNAALSQLRVWLEATPEVRADLTPYVANVMSSLTAYAANRIGQAQPEDPRASAARSAQSIGG